MKYLLTLAFCGLLTVRAGCQTYDTAVDAGGHRLEFHIVKGKGTGMPILFEGGAGADETVFYTILKPIEAITHATLITYARAGNGRSELDTSNHILEKHGLLQDIEGLETALKKLGYDHSIVLVAHSYGGFCATLYAARHPSTVKAAVFIDANLACWFLDSYVDSITQLRKKLFAAQKDTNWANYYPAMNLPNTVALMRKTPFPATIPAIGLVSAINFPDSTMAQRWRECHRQFAAAEPNREDITAYGCGHFIFRDNPSLVISAIVKAYAGAQPEKEADEVMKRYLSYSLEAFDEVKKKKVP